jgi:hypothetical protein
MFRKNVRVRVGCTVIYPDFVCLDPFHWFSLLQISVIKKESFKASGEILWATTKAHGICAVFFVIFIIPFIP